jgi:hypothetical protein
MQLQRELKGTMQRTIARMEQELSRGSAATAALSTDPLFSPRGLGTLLLRDPQCSRWKSCRT